ncbi:hypothetical protein SAMN04489740_1985 [Arthrobacter alpinus]|uniref:SipW-cognate class signal peptide n=1 Tax=Arthrobacter alpinus TaxID=656366 RepID=A0A1H5KH05_9MICC|nr:hypothetical protein SAMN04489740_1985 [Arthrobacter alpinus]
MLVVLLASAQGTAALLRAQSELTPGTITTGKLAIKAGNGSSSDTDYVFSDLNNGALVPGGYRQAPLTISNAGNVAMTYSLTGASSAPSAPTQADIYLAATVDLTVYAVGGSAACQPGVLSPGTVLYQGKPSSTATFAPRHLTAQGIGSAEVLCVRISLPQNADQRAAGGKLRLVLSWRGDQA